MSHTPQTFLTSSLLLVAALHPGARRLSRSPCPSPPALAASRRAASWSWSWASCPSRRGQPACRSGARARTTPGTSSSTRCTRPPASPCSARAAPSRRTAGKEQRRCGSSAEPPPSSSEEGGLHAGGLPGARAARARAGCEKRRWKRGGWQRRKVLILLELELDGADPPLEPLREGGEGARTNASAARLRTAMGY